MFPGLSSTTLSSLTKGLTLTKVLGGASKTLNFVNQAIPLYYQVKPVWSNAKTLINMYGAMKDDKPKQINSPKATTKTNTQTKQNQPNEQNSLTFFQ